MRNTAAGSIRIILVYNRVCFTKILRRVIDLSRFNCIILDMDETKKEITEILNKEKYIVLATCADEHVTARTMSYVNTGLDIFFQTDRQFLKVQQMLKNPRVALCTGNLQIEGIVKMQGHPLDHINIEFSNLYKIKHPHSFDKYTSLKEEIVVKVEPYLFTLWKYIDGKPCRDYLNLFESRAYRDFYRIHNS